MRSRNVSIIFVVLAVVLVLNVILWNGKAEAQEKPYPSKPITFIVTSAPGGPADVGTRIVLPELQKELGVALNVEYKTGAGGMIGTSYVSTAKPDGYTILSGMHGPFTTGPGMEKKPPYDPVRDFTPLGAYVLSPNVLAACTPSVLTSFEAMVKISKEKPGVLNCATSGIGTSAHFTIELMKNRGVTLTQIPTKGAAPAITELLGKHVDLALIMYQPLIPHIKSGEVKILIATDRISQDPTIPTFMEKGFPEVAYLSGWQAFFGPRDLPKPVQERLTASIRKVVQTPSVVSALEKAMFTVQYWGPDELRNRITEGYGTARKLFQLMQTEK